MEEIRIVLLGFGSANRALVEMLCSKSELLGRQRSLRINRSGKSQLIPWRVVSIVTGRHGAVCIPTETDLIYEVNLQKALKVYESGRMLDDSLIVDQDGACILSKSDYRESAHHATGGQTIELLRTLAASNSANVVIEAIPSNPRNGEGEPAVSFIRAALLAGLHVVSANKGPLAQQLSKHEEVYWNLQHIAAQSNVQYLHESAVMDGVPIFSLWQRTLPNASVTKIRGCLNSTTTMILTEMEGPNGHTFDEALHKAKEMGIVEKDESLDIDGYDAAVKLRALLVVFSNSSEGCQILVPSIDDIHRDSIRNITREDIQRAYNDDRKKYRLVATAGKAVEPLFGYNII